MENTIVIKGTINGQKIDNLQNVIFMKIDSDSKEMLTQLKID